MFTLSRVLVVVGLVAVLAAPGVAAGDEGRVRWADRAPGTVVPLVGTGSRATADEDSGGPRGLAAAPDGTVYYTKSHRVVAVAPDGTASTVVGSEPGFSGDGGPAIDATLDSPSALATDRDGNLYIADTDNRRVRKVDTAGTITTVAELNPTGLAAGPDGALYVVDADEGRVQRIDPSGAMTTVIGGGDQYLTGSMQPTDVGFGGELPLAIAVGGDGGVYVSTGRAVHRVAAGQAEPVVGDDRPDRPLDTHGIAVGPDGTLLLADPREDVVRGLRPDGTLTTIAELDDPSVLTADPAGTVFVATDRMTRIRAIGPDGAVRTVAEPGPAAVGADAAEVAVTSADAVAVGSDGTVFAAGICPVLAMGADDRIRSVVDMGPSADLAAGPDGSLYTRTSGEVHRVDPDGTTTPVVAFPQPRVTAIATGPAGELYVASGTHVDRVDGDGTLRPVADLDGVDGFTVDELQDQTGALAAIAVARNGDVYVAATTSNRVFAVTTDGGIHPFAGDGTEGDPEDGGDATASPVESPRALAVANDGTLYISTTHGVRRVSADGGIDTVGGLDEWRAPAAVAVDAHDNLYVALPDGNQVVAVVRPGEVASPFGWRVAWWAVVVVAVAAVAFGALRHHRRRPADRGGAREFAHTPPPTRDYWT